MIERSATVGTPMTLDYWVEDDALYSSGSNAPVTQAPLIVDVIVNKYRGPGAVTIARESKLVTVTGGKPAEAYSGRGSTTISFSEPGSYLLHVTVNDLSGPGGGATGCCWTTAILKVDVKA